MSPFPSEPLQAPQPDDDNPKEAYTFFGLASYAAQVLERGLLNFGVILQAVQTPRVTSEMIDDLFDAWEPKTFGKLLAAARQVTEVPADLDAELRAALVTRNRLTHRFFSDHAEDFMSARGRRAMIEELRSAINAFSMADHKLEAITLRIMRRHGITADLLEREWLSLLERAEARDSGDVA